jgi:hypothetical protein
LSGGAAMSALPLVSRSKRSEVTNAYENHEVAFHRGIALDGVRSARWELPSRVRDCSLCDRLTGGYTGRSRRQILLGNGILSNGCALQSGCADRAFWECPSFAGLGLPDGVLNVDSGAEEATDTLCSVDNKSGAERRVTVTPQARGKAMADRVDRPNTSTVRSCLDRLWFDNEQGSNGW